MEAKNQNSLLVSDQDYNALLSLTSSGSTDLMNQLEDELNKAKILPSAELPEDVVTMHSTVELIDLDSGAESKLTLVFPHEADVKESKVSILAPMGVALIGLRSGQSSEWPMPSGKEKHFKIKAVAQPKAA